MLGRFVCFVAAACLLLIAPSVRADANQPAWQRAIGPWAWSFPRDHGAHPAFQTEWWYFTGNLNDAQNNRYGYQLTIFRQGVQFTPAQTQSRWAVRDFYFGHFTVTDIAAGQFRFAEKVSRGAVGEAHTATDHMDVALGPWSITQDGAKESYHLVARDGDHAIDFEAHPAKPLVLEGVNGLSQKASGAGEASYYYSYPRLATSGHLEVDGKSVDVSGLSWFDHEFSTSSLGGDQVGWDWFCIQLDNHEEIMLYALRDKSGAMDPTSQGTWVKADGTTERLVPGSFTIAKLGTWRSPHSLALYPAGWHITVPGHHADLTITPAVADQELHLDKTGSPLDYWEGSCSISGHVGDIAVKGVGYTELTGYSCALQLSLKP